LGTLDRRIVSGEAFDAADDEAAISEARKLLKDRDLEICTESRRVGELQATPSR
jgi:hypothetical protein